jgi:hypothetical protein
MSKFLQTCAFIFWLAAATGVLLTSAYFMSWELVLWPLRSSESIKALANKSLPVAKQKHEEYAGLLARFPAPHYRYYRDVSKLEFSIGSELTDPQESKEFMNLSLDRNIQSIIPRNPLDSSNWLFSAFVLHSLDRDKDTARWLKNAMTIAPYSPYQIFYRTILAVSLWKELGPTEQQYVLKTIAALCSKYPWDSAYYFHSAGMMKIAETILGKDSPEYKEFKRIVDHYRDIGKIQ